MNGESVKIMQKDIGKLLHINIWLLWHAEVATRLRLQFRQKVCLVVLFRVGTTGRGSREGFRFRVQGRPPKGGRGGKAGINLQPYF